MWLVTGKNDIKIILDYSRDDLIEEKNVFLKSFSVAYQDNYTILNDIKERKKVDLQTFLNNEFQNDLDDFTNQKLNTIFITAKTIDGKIIGYVSFNKVEDGVYVRHLVVDPSFSHIGIGKFLVFSVLNVWKCQKLHVATRKANKNAVTFYQRLGFIPCDSIPDELDPEIFCGLIYTVSDEKLKEIQSHYQFVQIMFLPITNHQVKNLPIDECNDRLVDLNKMNHKRIVPMKAFDQVYDAKYQESGNIREGLYQKLLLLLEHLPNNIGIAFFEGYRPLWKQKKYFDKKFKELLQQSEDHDMEKVYAETSKLVSPFIDNIPVHCTGAAIDLTLFSIDNDGTKSLLDMGKFGVIFGSNDQTQTLSDNVTEVQRNNRAILLQATAKAGLVNYGYEWWHYSYGDRAWAYVERKEKAMYGLVPNQDANIHLPTSKEAYFETLEIA
jgi:D-alanyl-D-alanine dipeptidase